MSLQPAFDLLKLVMERWPIPKDPRPGLYIDPNGKLVLSLPRLVEGEIAFDVASLDEADLEKDPAVLVEEIAALVADKDRT